MSKLAVILPYHNPMRWKTRKRNYQLCRDLLEKQHANCFAVECGYLAHWEIEAEIKTHSSSVIWQKERLINHALTQIPAEYDCIAWVDGDILFADDDWVEKTIALLDTSDYVQLFSTLGHLSANNSERDDRHVERQQPGMIAEPSGNSGPGGAWAAQRSKLAIYDKHITGGGDSFLYNLIYQRQIGLSLPYWEHGSRELRLDMVDFAERCIYSQPLLTVGYLPQKAYHLFHGSTPDRNYCERHKLMREYKYNPLEDIANVNGAWEWASEKPEFHEALKKYFLLRNEDLFS